MKKISTLYSTGQLLAHPLSVVDTDVAHDSTPSYQQKDCEEMPGAVALLFRLWIFKFLPNSLPYVCVHSQCVYVGVSTCN